jgi:cytochrome P450
MTITEDTAQDYLIPDKIAQHAVLPASYADETSITYPAYEWLRKNNPLGLAKLDNFDPLWLVTKHHDLLEVERQPDLFTSGVLNPILNDQPSDAFVRSLTGGSYRAMDVLVYMDPPEHTKVRAVANKWFMPRNIRRFEGQMRELARQAVDRVLANDGECDFVKDFALGYPLHVIMTLFGVPEQDEPIMLQLTQEFFGVHDDELGPQVAPEPDAAARAFAAATEGFFAYFSALNADRRANPTDDLLSLIANSEIDGQPISEGYANGWYIAIATAGHDTTSSTISGAALELAKRPDQLAKVRADPALIPRLIEESLRWVSPVKHFMRAASRDTDLRGRRIKEGDRLMLLYASANRDEEVFDHADQFDIERDVRHVAFGAGPHACVGMHVVRLEMKVLFEELLPRIKGIELTGEPRWLKTNFVGGLRSMPVKLIKA